MYFLNKQKKMDANCESKNTCEKTYSATTLSHTKTVCVNFTDIQMFAVIVLNCF